VRSRDRHARCLAAHHTRPDPVEHNTGSERHPPLLPAWGGNLTAGFIRTVQRRRRMIIVMKKDATQPQIDGGVQWIKSQGFREHLSGGEECTLVGVIGNDRPLDHGQAEVLEGVERVVPILAPYKLASLSMQPEPTFVPLNGLKVGDTRVALIAGPCSVES